VPKEFIVDRTYLPCGCLPVVEEAGVWIVIIRGDAEGRQVRVALDFYDTTCLVASSRYSVGAPFIERLLRGMGANAHWAIKTVIEEVRTPQNDRLAPTVPLFVLLSKSQSRGLSAGALFIGEETSTPVSLPSLQLVTDSAARYILSGVSPVGFAAAYGEDCRLFGRFLTRLLNHPEAFSEVSLLLPVEVAGAS
jgi:hypothetical protein